MRSGCGKGGIYQEYFCSGLLFLLIISITVLGRPLESLDELWQYSYGSNIRRGCLPYRDINVVTTPFSQYMGAAVLRMFGDCLLVYRCLGTALGTLCMLLFYDILRIAAVDKRLRLCLSVYVCTFYSSCFTYDYNYLLLFWLLAIMDMMLRPAGRYDIVIGGLAGCAVMTKQSTGLVLFASVTCLRLFLREETGRRQWILYGAGVLLPTAGCCVWMAGKGIWADFLDYAFGGMEAFAGQNGITVADFLFRSGILCTAEGILWIVILAAGLRRMMPFGSIRKRRKRIAQWEDSGACEQAVQRDDCGAYEQAAQWGDCGACEQAVQRGDSGACEQAVQGEDSGLYEQIVQRDGIGAYNQMAQRDGIGSYEQTVSRNFRERRKWMVMAGLSMAGMAVVYPIADETHFVIALFPFLLMGICELSSDKTKKQTVPIILPVMTAVICILISGWQIRGEETDSGLKHLEGIRIDRAVAGQIETVDAYLALYAADRPVYILDGAAVLYKIPMDLYDKDYDVCLAGNWGSKTAEEAAERLLETDGVMLLAADGYGVNRQVPESFLEYIRERAVCVGRVEKYDVYLSVDGSQTP